MQLVPLFRADVPMCAKHAPFSCPSCRQVIWDKRAGAIYCSNSCRQRAYRKRKGANVRPRGRRIPKQSVAAYERAVERALNRVVRENL